VPCLNSFSVNGISLSKPRAFAMQLFSLLLYEYGDGFVAKNLLISSLYSLITASLFAMAS